MTQSLPDTLDLNDVEFSPDAVDNVKLVWGMLYATRKNFVTLALTKCEYTIGRSLSCDVVLSKEVIEEDNVMKTLSKFHFKIMREDGIVYVMDTSHNGTYVNGILVGKNEKVPLKNNDHISMLHTWYKVFVYIEEGESNAAEYPNELRKKYVVSQLLGSGAYGDVHLVFNKETSARYAMKAYHNRTQGVTRKDAIMNEVKILQKLKHPCIITLCDVIYSPEKVFIFLELMEGGNLSQRLDSQAPFPEKKAKWIFCQIVLAVEHLHSQGIAHRDLKPENILLSSDNESPVVKVTDFGLSKMFNSEQEMKTFCGTSRYLAPEILETRGCGIYTNKVDIWSIGVVLYACLSSHIYSNGQDVSFLPETLYIARYTFSDAIWKGISRSAIQLIKSMMTVDPNERIAIENIISHIWLQDQELQQRVKAVLNLDIVRRNENENARPLKRARFAL